MLGCYEMNKRNLFEWGWREQLVKKFIYFLCSDCILQMFRDFLKAGQIGVGILHLSSLYSFFFLPPKFSQMYFSFFHIPCLFGWSVWIMVTSLMQSWNLEGPSLSSDLRGGMGLIVSISGEFVVNIWSFMEEIRGSWLFTPLGHYNLLGGNALFMHHALIISVGTWIQTKQSCRVLETKPGFRAGFLGCSHPLVH